MLTSNFNSVAEHQRENDFNYGMKGDIADIGRIVTNNSQEHKSERYLQKQKKKFADTMRLLEHQLMGDLDGMLGDMRDDLAAYRENQRKINKGKALVESKDYEGMRTYLVDELGYDQDDVKSMSEAELSEEVLNKIDETSSANEKIRNRIIKIAQEFEEKLENNPDLFNKNPALKDQYLKELDKIQEEAEASGITFKTELDNANFETGTNLTLIREKVAQTENTAQSNDGTELTESTAEVAEAQEEVASKSYESAFPEMEGVLKESFAAVNGASLLDNDLSKNDDLDREQKTAQDIERNDGPPTSPFTPGG